MTEYVGNIKRDAIKPRRQATTAWMRLRQVPRMAHAHLCAHIHTLTSPQIRVVRTACTTCGERRTPDQSGPARTELWKATQGSSGSLQRLIIHMHVPAATGHSRTQQQAVATLGERNLSKSHALFPCSIICVCSIHRSNIQLSKTVSINAVSRDSADHLEQRRAFQRSS